MNSFLFYFILRTLIVQALPLLSKQVKAAECAALGPHSLPGRCMTRGKKRQSFRVLYYLTGGSLDLRLRGRNKGNLSY
jgi:hypothetical protein